jgi:hypothetical protein
MVGAKSTSYSSQVANAKITQQYAGSCDVSCNNTISGVTIDLINSILTGGINFSQACTANANCLFETNQNSITDVVFKATNSASAAGGIIPGISISETGSYQNINESILQSVSQSCAISSANDISNVSIFAESSDIGGGINFTQVGNTQADCTFDTLMSATAYATGTADNCSASGKKEKKQCGGKSGSIGTYLLYGGIALVAFVGIMVVIKMMRGTSGAVPPTTGGLTSKGGVAANSPSSISTAKIMSSALGAS